VVPLYDDIKQAGSRPTSQCRREWICAGHQPEHGEGARTDSPAHAARYRRRV